MNIHNNKENTIHSICFFNFNKSKPSVSKKTIDDVIASKAPQSIYVGTECVYQTKLTTTQTTASKESTLSSPITSSSTSQVAVATKESKEIELAKRLGLIHKEKDIFFSPQGREFSLTSFIRRMTTHDMSGILSDKERLIANPKDFETLILLSECVCPPDDVVLLKNAKRKLIELKTTLLETFGFAKDKGGLVERLSLLATVLSYPLAFGAENRDDTTDRAVLLFEIKKYMDTKWPMDLRTGRGRNPNDPCWFPCNQFSDESKTNIEKHYLNAGFPLRFKAKDQKYSGIALNHKQDTILERNPVFVPIRGFIEKCILRTSNSDGVCINDEAPNYFMGLFPPGMLFAESDYDALSFNERLQKLGGFAQAVLKPIEPQNK